MAIPIYREACDDTGCKVEIYYSEEKMEEVLVSVWCLTYNHELYIEDAIEGFLAQKTQFKYEIVIHDDASTDRTPEIIRNYEEKYPDLIHGIYQQENQTRKNGTDRKWIWSIQAQECKGKYIAFCEGDDYWIDLHKLQIQVDYMERNPECVLTVHDAVIINKEQGNVRAMHPYNDDCDITSDEIIMQYQGILPTASMIFRRDALSADFYNLFLEAGIGDYPLQLWLMTKGTIRYFSRIMSVYRYMIHGSWSKRTSSDFRNLIIHTAQIICLLEKYNRYTNEKYQISILNRIERFRKHLLVSYQRQLSLEDFEKMCNQYDKETSSLYREGFSEIEEYFCQFFNSENERLFNDIRKFCLKYSYIFIMGAGNFAGIIANQLKYSNIDFMGFVVSGQKEMQELYLKKSVWTLDKIPFPLEKVGIIIGLNLEKWTDVLELLEKKGIKNYLISSLLKGLMKMGI